MRGSRILLADDHTLVAEALRGLLEPEFEVVGICADGREVLDVAERLGPDAIVLDIGMPVLNGLLAGERVKKLLPGVRLVYLTASRDADLAAEALRIGASAYLLKTATAAEFVHAVREALRGCTYVTPEIARALDEAFIRDGGRRKRATKLTPRQCEVLQLFAEGRSMKQIAAALNITPRTVAFHKYAMMDELQIRTNAELIQFALTSVVSPPERSVLPIGGVRGRPSLRLVVPVAQPEPRTPLTRRRRSVLG